MMIKLQVLIATYGEEGLARLASAPPPVSASIEWVIGCQCPGLTSLPVPDMLRRSDIRIHFFDNKGLSRNRNNLLTVASAPYCMIADDDLIYYPEALHRIIGLFDSCPDLDIVIARYENGAGKSEKNYPSHPTPLFPLPKGYYISSFEIFFRLRAVAKQGIRFNESFGVGAPDYGSGEEDLWINDLRLAGLKGLITTWVATCHTGPTTGIREAASPRILRAQGAVFARLYPLSSILRVPLKAWRTSRLTKTRFLTNLKLAMRGWWEGVTRRKKLFPKS